MPETMARRTYEAHREAGASREAAGGAAADIGDLAGEVRILRWMVGTLIGVTVAGFLAMGAALFQIAVRLPGGAS